MKTNDVNNTPIKICRAYYPWLVIFLCSLFLFYKYVLQISPSVMTDELTQTFHLDGVGLGNLAATYFYSYLIIQLFVGPLLDKYSPRLLITFAIAISALGAGIFSQSDSLGYALLGRSLIGFGAAFATVSYMKMAAIWFQPKQFALVGGTLATAAMLGSISGQAPLALLVNSISWRLSMVYLSLIGFILAVIFYVFVHNNQPNNQHITENKSINLRDILNILQKKYNWLLMLYSGLAFAPIAVFGGLWGNPFLRENFHLSDPKAATLTSMMFFGLAVGGPVLGFISDKIGNRFWVMVFSLTLSCISLSCAIYIKSISIFIEASLLFLLGFGTGAFMLGFAMGKEINPPKLTATIVGLINTGDALFGAFSEPLVGKLLDITSKGQMVNGKLYFNVHDFHLAFLILPVYLIVALVCLLLIRYCIKLT